MAGATPTEALHAERAGGGASSQTRDERAVDATTVRRALHALPTEPPPANHTGLHRSTIINPWRACTRKRCTSDGPDVPQPRMTTGALPTRPLGRNAGPPLDGRHALPTHKQAVADDQSDELDMRFARHGAERSRLVTAHRRRLTGGDARRRGSLEFVEIRHIGCWPARLRRDGGRGLLTPAGRFQARRLASMPLHGFCSVVIR